MSDSQSIAANLPRLREQQVTLAVTFLVALKLIILLGFALNTRFVMDEFGQLGYAKYFGHGLFETILPAKAVGSTAFYKLALFIGWDAPSMALAGRIMTAIVACATLAIVFSTARALGEDRLRALCIILILLSFSNFIERIFRTIAEPLAVFFAAAALLVVLRGSAITYKRVFVAGLLSGLAFLMTQKSVYFNLALGLGLTLDALLSGDWKGCIKRGIWLVAGWLLAIVGYCFLFGGSDPLPVAHSLFFGPRSGDARRSGIWRASRLRPANARPQHTALRLLLCRHCSLTLQAAEFGQRQADRADVHHRHHCPGFHS